MHIITYLVPNVQPQLYLPDFSVMPKWTPKPSFSAPAQSAVRDWASFCVHSDKWTWRWGTVCINANSTSPLPVPGPQMSFTFIKFPQDTSLLLIQAVWKKKGFITEEEAQTREETPGVKEIKSFRSVFSNHGAHRAGRVHGNTSLKLQNNTPKNVFKLFTLFNLISFKGLCL